ncbi:MAG TPA: ABC transporter permease [Thermoanaerobaculia bacterium]|nr:ABC transporter permease [Thermoanaerobaculia bacterium]
MRAPLALARREVVRFFRQKSRVVGAVAPPLVMWAVVGSGLGGSFRPDGASPATVGSSLAFFFPGTVVLVVLFAAIFSTITVIEDRREGFLQGVLVSPVGPRAIVFGKVLGGTLLGTLQGGALLALVPLLGLPVDGAALAAAAALLFVLAFALTSLGFLIAWSLDSTQGFHAIMNLFLVPLWLLSGAFFPASGAPAFLRGVMALNPLTYGVAALRRALGGGGASLPGWGLSAAVTVLFAAALYAAALLVATRRPALRGGSRLPA